MKKIIEELKQCYTCREFGGTYTFTNEKYGTELIIQDDNIKVCHNKFTMSDNNASTRALIISFFMNPFYFFEYRHNKISNALRSLYTRLRSESIIVKNVDYDNMCIEYLKDGELKREIIN